MKNAFISIFIVLFYLSPARLGAQEANIHYYLMQHNTSGLLSDISGQLSLIERIINREHSPSFSVYSFGKLNPFKAAENELRKNNFDLSDLFFAWTECLNDKSTVERTRHSVASFESLAKTNTIYELILTKEESLNLKQKLDLDFDPKNPTSYIYHRSQKNSVTQIRDLLFEVLQLDKSLTETNLNSVTVHEAEMESVALLIQENIPESSLDAKTARTLAKDVFNKFDLQTAGLFISFPEKVYNAQEYERLLQKMQRTLKMYFPESSLQQAFEKYYFDESVRKEKLGTYDSLFIAERLLATLKTIAPSKLKIKLSDLKD